jgi:hypothetical protein
LCVLNFAHHTTSTGGSDIPVMPIRETASSSDQSSETNLSSSTTTITPNMSTTKYRHYRHPLRLPTFWRDHPYIRTTGRKTRRRRFVDVHGVMRTLHARAEKPFRVLGQEITLFRKYKNTNCGTGAMLSVSNLPLKMMQEELLVAINRSQSTSDSRYVCLFPFSLKQLSFLSGLILGPESKYAFFIYLNESYVEQIEYSLASSYHGPGANSAHRTCGELSIQLVLRVFGERSRAPKITRSSDLWRNPQGVHTVPEIL